MLGKVINLLWRVCRGYLPTNQALVKKQVNISEICSWCHRYAETDTHVLFDCDFARTVWRSTSVHHLIQMQPSDTGFDVILRLFSIATRDQCVLIGMVCWSLWNRRNTWVWDRVNGSAFGVKAAALHLLGDWKEARAEEGKKNRAMPSYPRKWSKPPEGWIKFNMDAATFNEGFVGVGSVMRDDNGNFLGAKCSRIEGAWRPGEAEALSLKEALSWAKELNLNYCIFETDSKTLAEACRKAQGASYFDTIVSDCVQLIKYFDHVVVEFVYRSANAVAHVLARAAYSMSGLGEWFVTPPDFIHHVIDSDKV